MIIRNSATCGRCGDEIESEYCHDFKFCSCGSIAVDGGKDYVRRVGSKGVTHDEMVAWDTSIYSEDENAS